MKLEDCSKGELIYFIKRNMFYEPDRLEFDILMARSEAASNRAAAEGSKACDALKEYTDLLMPYDGKRLMDIPDEVIDKARQSDKYHKRYDVLGKQIDKILYAEKQ